MLGGGIAMNTYNPEIGALLKSIRNHHNYTLVQVSKYTGIAEETLRRIENGKFEPKLSTLNLLSDFFRIDLVELYSRKRSINSFFSEELIKAFNYYLKEVDYDGLKAYALDQTSKIKNKNIKHKSELINFLYSISQIKYKPKGSQVDTIANVESLLTSLNSSYLSDMDIKFPYPIEVSCIIYLSILYRQVNANDKAINLLKNTIRRINLMPYQNDRYINYLSTLYLNLSYSYHYLDMNQQVIDTINEVFHNQTISFTGYEMFNFLFRKGIAMFRLKDSNYQSVLVTAILTLPVNEQEAIKTLLNREYGITI